MMGKYGGRISSLEMLNLRLEKEMCRWRWLFKLLED